MKILLFALLLLTPAFAQTPVEPIRVAISTETEAGDEHEREFNRLVRSELRKRRDIVLTTRRVQFDLYLAALPITQQGKRTGFSVAVFVIIDDPGAKKRFHFDIWTGASLDALAIVAVEALDKEVFNLRRARE